MQTLLGAPAPAKLLLTCRHCGASIDPGAKASLLTAGKGIALDCACGACGKRALYHSTWHP